MYFTKHIHFVNYILHYKQKRPELPGPDLISHETQNFIEAPAMNATLFSLKIKAGPTMKL